LPLKAKFILDPVRIDGSILILPIFQKEDVAKTDAKANSEKSSFDLQCILNTKKQFEKPSYLNSF